MGCIFLIKAKLRNGYSRGSKQYGLIAQEVKEILLAIVTVGRNKDNIENDESLMSANYLQLIAILIKANQEQAEEIVELKKYFKNL